MRLQAAADRAPSKHIRGSRNRGKAGAQWRGHGAGSFDRPEMRTFGEYEERRERQPCDLV
ncbi:MAG: hypothetical protein WBP81_02730 [Solirubrobacteraceae bacterium]